MKRSFVLLVLTLLVLGSTLGTARGAEPCQTAPAAVATPHDAAAHNQAPPAEGHDHAAMLAAQAAAGPSEIDVLLKKMQSARGQAKIAIMADLISKLAAEHQTARTGGTAATGSVTSSTGGSMCCNHGSSASGGGHEMSCPMCAEHMKSGQSK